MPLAVKLGKGSVIRVGRGATPTWTTLDGLQDVAFPNHTATELDATHQGSPGRYEESNAGLIPVATQSYTGLYIEDSPTCVLLLDLFKTGEHIRLEVTANGGSPRTYDAYVKTYTPTMPLKGNMMFTVEFVCGAEITA